MSSVTYHQSDIPSQIGYEIKSPLELSGARKKRRRWDEWEHQTLVESRKNGESFEEISKKLPGRTVLACQQRFDCVLGGSSPAFSETENATLILLETKGASLEEMRQALPGRTLTMCKYRLLQLKSERRMTAKATGHATARKSQVKRPEKINLWTDQEDLLFTSLRDRGMTFRHISKYLTGRSANACVKHHQKRKTKLPGRSDDQNTINDVNPTPMLESEVRSRTNSHTSNFDTPQDGHIPILMDTKSSNVVGPNRQSIVPSTVDTVATDTINGYSSESERGGPHPVQIRDTAESRHVDLTRQYGVELSNGTQKSDVQESDAQEGDIQENDVQESDVHVQDNEVQEMSILDQLRITHPPQAKHGPPNAAINGRQVKKHESDLRERLQRLPEDIASIKKRFSQWRAMHLTDEERAQLNESLLGDDANATGGEVGEDETKVRWVPLVQIEDVEGQEGRVTVRKTWGF